MLAVLLAVLLLLKSLTEFLLWVVWILLLVLFEMVKALIPRMKKSLTGQVVLVTGAAQGMGREVCVKAAQLGAIVVLWDVNEEKLRDAAQFIKDRGGSAHWYVCDVTSEETVRATARRVEQEVGDVAVLVNNAGVMQNMPILELKAEGIRRTLDVNLLAHFWTIRAFLPSMERRGRGHIVALASCAGLVGHINQTDYSASKHGVIGLMEALSEELRLKGSNVKLTSVCPLTVNTGMNQNPVTRHSWLMPIVTVEDAANQILDAIQKEEFLVTIPRSTILGFRLSRLLPRRALTEFMDYTDYCRVKNSD